MNRRNIFKLIAGAACAAVMEITGIRPVMPRAAKYVFNPDYLTAAYEDVLILGQIDPYVLQVKRCGPTEKPMDLKIPDGCTVVGSPDVLNSMPDKMFKVSEWAMPRYNFVNGHYTQIPQYILQT